MIEDSAKLAKLRETKEFKELVDSFKRLSDSEIHFFAYVALRQANHFLRSFKDKTNQAGLK